MPPTPEDSDLQHCWELILKSNSQFRILYPFTSGEFSRQLVALHALFASLDRVVTDMNDESVARRKLDWWRIETMKESIPVSRHPVIRYLHRTGVDTLLTEPKMKALFESVGMRLEGTAPTNDEDFNKLCILMYQPRANLECSLQARSATPSAQQEIMVRSGALVLLLQESFGHRADSDRNFWWIPLNLLARVGISRFELSENIDAPLAHTVFQEMLSVINPLRLGSQESYKIAPGDSQVNVHQLLTCCLQNRQLRRLLKKRPSTYGDELNRFYFSDVFSIWKSARKLKLGYSAV